MDKDVSQLELLRENELKKNQDELKFIIFLGKFTLILFFISLIVVIIYSVFRGVL